MAEDDRSGRGLEIAEPESASTHPLLAVLERPRSALDRERAEAPALCAELLAQPAETALERIRHEARFQPWGLCELLLAQSAGAGGTGEAGRLAALALAGAERLDSSRHAAAVVAD